MPTIPYRNEDGEKLSGVTTIIGGNLGWNKQALMWWANQQGLEGKSHRDKTAAETGTLCHALIEAEIWARLKQSILKVANEIEGLKKTLTTEQIDMARQGLENFKKWADMSRFQPLYTEPHLVSEKYQYGATPDLIATIGEEVVLFDWKTSGGTYEDMLVQLSAYKAIWEEVHPDMPIKGIHLLRIGKADASFHHHYWQKLDEEWEVFKCQLKTHNLHKIIKKKL